MSVLKFKDNGIWKEILTIKGDTGNVGPQGPKGDTGIGVPSGGSAGQILKKKTNSDYDTEWGNETVSSVNNKTGSVTLTASDVGAYSKPSGGIPSTDLASSVQTSLGKADSALQSHQDISGKENSSNKVTSVSSSSTNEQYPSALAVYNFVTSTLNSIETASY